MSATILTFPDFWTYPGCDDTDRRGATIGTRAIDEAEMIAKLMQGRPVATRELLARVDRLEDAITAMTRYRPDHLDDVVILYPTRGLSIVVPLRCAASVLRELIQPTRTAVLDAAA